jgi:hypothetical protein
VFGTTASIDNFMGEVGGRSKFLKNLVVGAAVGLLAVVGLFAVRRARLQAATNATAAAGNPAGAAVILDPARAALEEAKELAAQGDLDLAHSRIATDVANSPTLREGPEVRDIEARWADAVLSRADREPDMTTRRMLLNSVAQSTTVDALRRRTAADKLKETDLLGTDIRELPQVAKSSPPAAVAEAPPVREPKEPREPREPKEPAAPRPAAAPRPILAADPWAPNAANRPGGAASTPAPEGSPAKASDLALQGRDGEARARAQLEPRVWGGHATTEEIKMLRAICKHMGDRACADRASAMLSGQK